MKFTFAAPQITAVQPESPLPLTSNLRVWMYFAQIQTGKLHPVKRSNISQHVFHHQISQLHTSVTTGSSGNLPI